MLRKVGQLILRALLPTECVVCHNMDEDPLCFECAAKLEHIGEYRCLRCGRRRSTTFYSPDCGECYKRPVGTRRARSVLTYNQTGRALLHAYKFRQNIGAGMALVEQLLTWGRPGLAARFDDPEFTSAVVVPVPLHPARRRKRGFNQAELFAYRLAERWRLPCRPEALQRSRDTVSQVGLSSSQRQRNVQGAFAVPGKHAGQVEGQSILLIDDLMTTGATLKACAVALRKARAGTCYALTVFSTVRDVEPEPMEW